MELPFERPAVPGATLREAWKDFGGLYAANAVVGFLFACTGPVAIILSAGTRGGLTQLPGPHQPPIFERWSPPTPAKPAETPAPAPGAGDINTPQEAPK